MSILVRVRAGFDNPVSLRMLPRRSPSPPYTILCKETPQCMSLRTRYESSSYHRQDHRAHAQSIFRFFFIRSVTHPVFTGASQLRKTIYIRGAFNSYDSFSASSLAVMMMMMMMNHSSSVSGSIVLVPCPARRRPSLRPHSGDTSIINICPPVLRMYK